MDPSQRYGGGNWVSPQLEADHVVLSLLVGTEEWEEEEVPGAPGERAVKAGLHGAWGYGTKPLRRDCVGRETGE